MKKSVVFPIMLAMGGVILSQMLAGCGGNNQMPKKEAENFKGGPMPEEWKNWKPGMPMPGAAKGSSAAAAPKSATQGQSQ